MDEVNPIIQLDDNDMQRIWEIRAYLFGTIEGAPCSVHSIISVALLSEIEHWKVYWAGQDYPSVARIKQIYAELGEE